MRKTTSKYWLAFVLMASLAIAWSTAVAQDTEETTNYGRQSREMTSILQRDPTEPLSDREKIHHLLSRVTFGPTAEAIDEVEAMGIKKWLKQQLAESAEEPDSLMDRIAKLESLPLTTQEIVKAYNQKDDKRNLRNVPQAELNDAVLLLAVYSKNQFKEVMCDYWRNHFSIDSSKGNARYYATTYERDVIRAEAFGSFAAMLNKQARHPAMLIYLDNYISRATPVGELNKIGRDTLMNTRDYGAALVAVDIARMRGINENFARELMELHTLGVDNFYTQDDVITVANALTGWTVQQNPEKPVQFKFRPDMHSSENRYFLKKPIPAIPGDSELEGQVILNMLAAHKGTSRFIAYKLCRYLVNDTPPDSLLKRASSRFWAGKSNLPKVYHAILDNREFYNPRHYQAKFKRPFEFVVSALRVTNAEIGSTRQIHRALASMGEPIYQCEDPTGYYDQADAWRDPGVMVNRWQFGLDLSTGKIKGVTIPDTYWDGFEQGDPQQWKRLLVNRILPGGCSKQTSEALDRFIATHNSIAYSDPDTLGALLLGLLLGSPEFQRQ